MNKLGDENTFAFEKISKDIDNHNPNIDNKVVHCQDEYFFCFSVVTSHSTTLESWYGSFVAYIVIQCQN